jgi:homoserine O-succinyltransferase/O-acetyltransferase
MVATQSAKAHQVSDNLPKIARVAVLDMYNGEENRGMPMLQKMLGSYAPELVFDVFDVRKKRQIPTLDYDIFLFSGGPGDPLKDVEPSWSKPFYDLIEKIWDHNRSDDSPKKYCFFICHSFQMACDFFKIGTIEARNKWSFGTYPTHKTAAGKREKMFEGLENDFFIADFRRFEVVKPQIEQLKKMGAEILCLEKDRPHVTYERAIMAVRFSPEIMGTQFHPEADPEGMLHHFLKPERKQMVVDAHGEPTYNRMINDLSDHRKIGLTHQTIIPRFIETSLKALRAGA